MNESRINLRGTKPDKTEEQLGRGVNRITIRSVGPEADEIAVCASQGSVSSPANFVHREENERETEAKVAICREFDRLQGEEKLSLNQAATLLGKSPSWFSGADAPYQRWKREGRAGLAPRPSKASGKQSEITEQIESLGWFIKAARYFNLNLNRTYDSGSVPEAVRRTISLPVLPVGWTKGFTQKFCQHLGLADVPVCPTELREAILDREKSGKSLVPDSVAKKITIPRAIVRRTRGPRAWALDALSAPGSQRRYFDGSNRVIMEPGDWFGGDDATPGIAVCVPCKEVITPCSQNFGVLLGRFQWLVFNDCRTDKILAWDYVVRPRGSYRAEDLLNGMGTVTRVHRIPRKGWQFEGGTFNAKLVRQAIELMKCEHWRTYSPHQKAIESVFNRVWTRLAAQFPHADMGRYRNENEANCRVYENCRRGHADPRRYFPTIELVVKMFEEEVAAHNTRRIVSEQYGQWVPDEFYALSVAKRPLREFSREMDWIFSPFAVERKVQGMMVRCRVPMFEDFSVPFEFNAPWMPLHHRKMVRMHFNPRDPKCRAKIVLLENSGEHKAGEILGDADLIGETTGHIRLIMQWADDNQQAGYIARQRTNHFMRRISRGIGAGGRVVYSADEQRDGIGQVIKAEAQSPKSKVQSPQETPSIHHPTPDTQVSEQDRAARLAELEAVERDNERIFQ